MAASSSNLLHNLLECLVCTNTMFPPIRQCSNGHTLCSNCKSRLDRCPICREDLGTIRCLALEKVAQMLEWPCKYQNVGCRNLFPYLDVLSHENNCKFRPYNCPAAGAPCPITGDIPFLVGHLKNDHKVNIVKENAFKSLYTRSNQDEVVNGSWQICVFNCLGHHFCLNFEAFLVDTAPVYMAFVCFMGEPCVAKDFGCCLQVHRNGRTLSWTGAPRSIRDSNRKVRDSLDGLIIHQSLALYYFAADKEELDLTITGCIWKARP